jgi:hypothetical protein
MIVKLSWSFETTSLDKQMLPPLRLLKQKGFQTAAWPGSLQNQTPQSA